MLLNKHSHGWKKSELQPFLFQVKFYRVNREFQFVPGPWALVSGALSVQGICSDSETILQFSPCSAARGPEFTACPCTSLPFGITCSQTASLKHYFFYQKHRRENLFQNPTWSLLSLQTPLLESGNGNFYHLGQQSFPSPSPGRLLSSFQAPRSPTA